MLISNKKWFCMSLYRPPNHNNLNTFFNEVMISLNKACLIYDNYILMGDFNTTTKNQSLKDLLNTFALDSLINEPTCFKSTAQTCIDLILTNYKNVFMKSSTFETGLSDFHK